ncbi:proclotting enzyme [Culex quinquefasciatus]|uniref:Proclotting enzyme n=1 Tax=Culex quinquefasciatus TaxID=7176 RepID=B0W6A6_CULQU|nr:proclotting enzyme [Culex quinquefasciatus]|eukprot:XP_001844240.1 proclotting enzyme [Culex quinquefasciatus]
MSKSLSLLCLIFIASNRASEVFQNAAFQCGIPKHANTLLIVNGVDAKISDWPWHAAIRLHLAGGGEPEYVCGGTLISERFVVTAAHCTLDPDNPNKAPRMSVQLGVNAVGSPEGKTFNVEKVHRHAGFSLEELRDDIALLELESPVEFTDFILPACLSKRTELAPGKLGAVVGWGVTENDIPSTKLKLAKLPVIDELECKRKEPELYGRVLTERVFCAGYVNGTTACNGDSGGGIVFERGDAWYLGGVVSFTKTRDGSHLCQTKTYSCSPESPPTWIGLKTDHTDFSQEYGIEKIVPCSTPGQPSGTCVPVQQCRDVFDTLRSPLLSEESANKIRQNVCELRGVRRSVCCAQDQVERIAIHRNAILLPLDCGVSKQWEPPSTAAKANVYEFPWIALIRSSKATEDHDLYCTGSLINNRYVLTTARCLKAKERKELDYVRLGERSLGQERDCDGADQCSGPPLDVKAVLPFILHPQTDKQSINNDLGLVRLQEKVIFTDNIAPVCLPIREDLRTTLPKEFTVSLFEGNGAGLELYKTRSSFVEKSECEERFEDFGYTPWVTDRMFCALAQGPKYLCAQHLGAPLITRVTQGDRVRTVQYGVTRNAETNCTIAQTVPKVYMNVVVFVDWILESISP